MDFNSTFGFIDLIVICVGFYGFYSWYMLVQKHEIKKTLLIGGNTTPQQCVDIEGFADFIGKKLLFLSAAMVIFGSFSAYNSFIEDVGMIIWVGMAIFLVIIVWYCIELRKADAKYFSATGKGGKSIKDKAMKR